jgi:preprotein translocase SecE subunit
MLWLSFIFLYTFYVIFLSMFKFIKESLAEFDHVVWPTPTETKKYMYYTIGTILVVGVLLAVADSVLRWGLEGIRDQFPHETPTLVSGETTVTRDQLEDLTRQFETKKNVASGTVSSGTTIVLPPSGTGNSGI